MYSNVCAYTQGSHVENISLLYLHLFLSTLYLECMYGLKKFKYAQTLSTTHPNTLLYLSLCLFQAKAMSSF